MKRILSVLLALVMIVGMIPMSILSASAAEMSAVLDLSNSANRTTFTTSQQVWTQNGITLTNNKGSSTSNVADYTPPRMYKSSEVIISCSLGNITKIEFVCSDSSYATALKNSVTSGTATVSGSTVTIVPATTSDTYTISSLTGGQVRMGNSITVTYATVDSGECAHTNVETIAAVAATCTTAGNTEGTKCADCGVILSGNETIAALGHSNDEGVVTAPTCTEDGYTLYTCTVCGSSAKSDWVDATGHTYVDGVCSCGVALPTDLDGKYYIAAIRSSGNYQYMTNDLGTATTLRYQIVDSGLTTLPESIETIVDAQVFELIASGDGYKIKTGDQYLGWTSGNSGALVDEASAIVATIENGEAAGSYQIHFAASDAERYLSLNSNASNAYYAWYKPGQVQDLYLVPVSENAEACTHANTTTNTVAASCGVAGSETVVCNDCGETVSTTVIPALEHNYVDGTCSNCGEAEVIQPAVSSATISFADTTQRVSQDTSSQVWQNNGLTVTNNKSASTSNVIDSSNPVRFYKNSDVIIAFAGMTKIEVACNTAAYATALQNSISNTSVSVSVSEKVVTIVPNGAIDSYTITLSGGQVRVDSITVTASTCEHVWGEMVQTSAPTCTVAGVNTSTCTLCGETKTETVPATGHTYTYVDGSMTCACGDVAAISTIAEAKAYTSTSKVYYIKGIVTYVSGKNVYIEDATGAICVYFAAAPSDIALGDEIVVWDTMTAYNGLIETTNTTAQEYLKVSSGNALPSQTVTIADLLADTTNEYLAERVVIENVTMGVINTSGNTPLTDADGNSINLYKVSGLNEAINVNDVVTATVIVSTYNAYQLLVNPGTAADDVVEVEHHDEVVVETVDISAAKAGTVGEYYQVEGTVTLIDGRNIYIQDATGGIVVYLTADNTTAAVGDKIKAYGQLKLYNGLIELDGIDQTNTDQFEVLSNDNVVEAQATTIADLKADTTNEYLAEKITLSGVYVSYVNYSSSYGNVTYKLYDSNGNFIEIYRMTVASEEEVIAVGSQIDVEAIVSSYNGYQLVTSSDKITVTGTCAHETTQLVNYVAATCTEAGYSGDTMCTTCGYYTVKGAATEALGHSFTENGTCANGCGTQAKIVMNGEYYTSFDDANAAFDGHPMKLLANIGEDAPVTLTQNTYVDLNGFTMNAYASVEYTIFGMDSCTDSYEAEEWGYLTVSGNATVAPVTNNSYLAVDEGDLGWSFHAFSVKLTHVSLKADADALGYKAQFQGDEMVQSKVTGFGFNLWVTTNNVITKSQATAANEEIITLRLQGIMAANGGAVPVFAEAFVTFEGVENAVKTNPYNTTMKDTIETIETQLELGATAYSAEQIKSIQGLIEKYESKMSGWNIDTIKAWPVSTEA